ncbi:hypothetical protein ACFYRC_14085 [Streptomyces sp. NPDC005279]|uniref:hypothetical protein n=1 Tax=Streptomyces sp. NPDC005279 TaxID=3364712 RepID=UPI003676A874
MDINPDEVVTVELDCDGWTEPYARDITRRQLGELLLQFDDMAEAAVTADQRPDTETWPTPDTAYAKAPSIISEIGWTAEQAVGRPTGALLGREFWLRKAAVLDRIALRDEAENVDSDATEVANDAARRLLDRNGDDRLAQTGYADVTPDTRAVADLRGYVRREYALWAKNQ